MDKRERLLTGMKILVPLTVAMVLVSGTAWNDALTSGRHLDGNQIFYVLLVTALTFLIIGLLWALLRAWKRAGFPPSE